MKPSSERHWVDNGMQKKPGWENLTKYPISGLAGRCKALLHACNVSLLRWVVVWKVELVKSSYMFMFSGLPVLAFCFFLNWLHNCQHRVWVSFFLQCQHYLLWGPLSAHIQHVCRQKLPAGNELWLKLRCWATVQAPGATGLLCIQVSELSGTGFAVV
mgnify:CR=1 FL=1